VCNYYIYYLSNWDAFTEKSPAAESQIMAQCPINRLYTF